MPSFENQKKAGDFLYCLNAKIELNNKINAELEGLAKLVYDYWFVQFDFPNGDGKPYRQSGGKMRDDEELKREVPEGWEVKRIGDIVKVLDSKRVPLSNAQRENRKGPYPYYGATGVMDYIDDFIFDGDYILVAEDGSVMDKDGKAIVQQIYGKTWVNNHAHVLQPKEHYNLDYLFQLFKTISVVQIMTGSIQKKITQDNLTGVKLIYPDRKILEKFSKIVSPMREQQVNLQKENQHLSELRDWLLPLLMNGQVGVG